ncbi:MAG: class I SAM-dependent methyltransferase [Pirellulales bacterium]
MNVEASYNRWASCYDSMVNPTRDLDREAAQTNFAGRSFSRILEVGCGTGKNTQWMTEFADHIVAMDLSEEMLHQAMSKVSSSKVHWRRADIRNAWGDLGDPFDLITFHLVLEHVQDLLFVFDQADRTLMPGGFVYVSELHPFKQYLGSQARFESEHGTQLVEAYLHHVSDYVSAAKHVGWKLVDLGEWFDSEPVDSKAAAVPRLITLMFQRPASV